MRRTLPAPFRARASQLPDWEQRFDAEARHIVDGLLRELCDAFMFDGADRYRFSPDDRLADIYRACYRHCKFWRWGDSMELETLMMDLQSRFHIDLDDWNVEMTLGELCDLAVERLRSQSREE